MSLSLNQPGASAYEFEATKPVWILYHHSQEALAKATVEHCHNILKQAAGSSQSARSVELKPIIQWGSFRDGFPDLFIRDVKQMAGKDVIFIASFHSVDVIFEQISLIYALPRYLAHSLTVILPYFPTGTMERVDHEGQIATASTLAKLLSVTATTARGPTQFLIFDIHALQERFYFSNNVIPRLETAIPLAVSAIQLAFPSCSTDQLAVVFPDEGAQKRFSQAFPPEWHNVCFTKVRNGDKRQIQHKEGDPKGRHAILIDDLVQTGGTLLESANLLRTMGCLSVSAYVTHAVFPLDSWRKFTHAVDGSGVLQHFWITDSVPHAVEIAKHKPFELLSLAPQIVDVLLGFDLKC